MASVVSMDRRVEHRMSQEQRHVVISGKQLQRLPHEFRVDCPCGAKQHELHHIGCHHEQCPVCHWPLAVCDCQNGG